MKRSVYYKLVHNWTGLFTECFYLFNPKLMTVIFNQWHTIHTSFHCLWFNVNNTNNVLVVYLQWLVVYNKANTETIDLDLKAKQWLTTTVSMTKTISRKFIPSPLCDSFNTLHSISGEEVLCKKCLVLII